MLMKFRLSVCVSCTMNSVLLSCSFAPAQVNQPRRNEKPETVFHVEAREAVIDVVARDDRSQVISDLTAEELQVYEIPDRGSRISRPIQSLTLVDPEDQMETGGSTSGFRVSSGAVCALNTMVHYQIAILTSPQPGYHRVLIKTTRPHVTLTFRNRYYVGFTGDSATPKVLAELVTPQSLLEAACYHPLTPPTLSMVARVIDITRGKAARYEAKIKPESMSLIGFNGDLPRLRLDFGICLFDATGEITGFLHSYSERQLTDSDRSRMLEHGLIIVLEVPGNELPVLARVAVLDRSTGNLGIIDVAQPLSIVTQSDPAKRQGRISGDIRGFGSVIPRENAFCGDVYELLSRTSSLLSFHDLEPVASLYSSSLNIPNQNITMMGGIPGVTHSSLWFGVDYYGRFYVAKAGSYVFELQSDDSARLEIDNHLLIDLDGIHHVLGDSARADLSVGWHSIHVPYFQGPPTSLALVLRIQLPGESMHIFNLNEFVPRANKDLSTHSAPRDAGPESALTSAKHDLTVP